MKKTYVTLSALLIMMLLITGTVLAAETVAFEPVRAPAMGPDTAPVTIIEIADFM